MDGGAHYTCTVPSGVLSQSHTVNARSGICSCHRLLHTERRDVLFRRPNPGSTEEFPKNVLYSTRKGKWPEDTLGCPHLELGACRGWLTSYAIRSAMGTLPAYAKVGNNKYSRIRLHTNPTDTTSITLHPHAWKLVDSRFRFIINMELGICECSNTGFTGACSHIKELGNAFPLPTPPPSPPSWSAPLSVGTSSGRKVNFAGITDTRWIPSDHTLALLLINPDSFIHTGGISFQCMGLHQGKILWQFSEKGKTFQFRPDDKFCECDEFDEAPLTNLSCSHLRAFRAKMVETETIVIE
jgi:hypothetical protein